MYIDTGSPVYTRGDTALNKATIALHGKGALCAHAALGYDSVDIVHALIKKGVHKADWEELRRYMEASGIEYCILERKEPYTLRQKIQIQTWLESMLTWTYSMPELFFQLLDGIIERVTGRHVVFFRRLGDIIQTKVICSKAPNRALVKIVDLPREAYYWTPQETYEYQMKHGWRMKYHTEDWFNG